MIIKKISHYTLFVILTLVFSTLPGLAAEQITVLVSSENPPYMKALAGLHESLKSFEADITLDIYHLDNETIKAELVVERIKIERPDVIITIGALAFNTAANEIDDIPIVAGMILTKRIFKTHLNATGVVLEIPVDIQFSWLKKFFPSVQNIGVLYNQEQNAYVVQEAHAHANTLGLNLIAHPVSSPLRLPTALKKLVGKAEILWGISDTVVLNKKTAKNILLFSFRNKIPFVGLSNTWVKSGAYYALDRDYHDIGAQCGEIVNKILDGTDVKTIAPTSPRKITYSLNTRTAKKMKMSINHSLINKADKVY